MRHSLLIITALLACMECFCAHSYVLPDDLEIIFVVRPQYINEHGTEATMYQTGEVNTSKFQPGAALKKLNLETNELTTLLSTEQGSIRDPELSYDAKKILFSMRKHIGDDYHIYEMNADGSGLRQLTFGSNLSDIQPIYLPDGKIAFSSTRDVKYIPCQRHLMANLFKMDADGSNILQLGYNTQFEGRASMMPDGRILYTRWEYVDKHFAPAYGLWTVNPDGTDHALFYGGYSWQPSAISDARMIPGTNKFVAIFTAVHELAWGAMVVADQSVGDDGMKPIIHSWPEDIAPYMSAWDRDTWVGSAYDSFRKIKVKYQNPFPLSEQLFLCARQIEEKAHTGIYLLDDQGSEKLLYQEAPGCFEPIPVLPREKPPVIPSKVDYTKENGYFYMQDAYVGEQMNHVERGSIKYLRVVEAPAKRSFIPYGVGDWAPADAKDNHHPAAVNWHHYNNKKILGTVEVEEDGSVYFEAPSGKFLYFQLLDKDKKMIHSMRSGTMLQPGEIKGCVGCHEDKRNTTPVNKGKMLALTKAPQIMKGWYGEAREFGFSAEVQPVLDKHCIQCHDYGKEAAYFNLSGDKGIVFNQSYTNLMRRTRGEWKKVGKDEPKELINVIGSGPVKELPPYSWGSTQSALVDMLESHHGGVNLDAESLERITSWIDLNGSYYPVQETFYRTNTVGRSPLNHEDLLRLGQLVLEQAGGDSLGWDKVKDYFCRPISIVMFKHGEPVNFTRPELSLCLQVFESKESQAYHEALGLIQKGKRNLEMHPRADMPGFKACDFDQTRLDAVNIRRESERLSRKAITNNTQ